MTIAAVTITDLNRHSSIIAFREKETKIINAYHLHIHQIDTEKFQSNFEWLNHTLKLLKQHDTTKEFSDVLDVRMSSLSDIFSRLKPIKHSKRGVL